MQDIKNWDKLDSTGQYLAAEMIDFLENDGELFMVCNKISRNGMYASFFSFLTIKNKNILFDCSIIEVLLGKKITGRKAFKIKGCGYDRALEVLFLFKRALNIKNQKQNYNCYYAD